MDWLRLWHDMPNDPKWRTIARHSKQRIGDVISVYVHLLVAASSNKDRGVISGVNPEDIASALDLDIDQIDAIMISMEGRVFSDGRLSGWDARQPLREDGATGARGKPGDNYVYFVATTGSDVVKIGISKNPWSRVKDLQNGTSEEFTVLATIKTPNRSEFDVHDYFKETRKHGEWFYRSNALNLLISKIKSKAIVQYDELTALLDSLPKDSFSVLRSDVVTTKDKIRLDEIRKEDGGERVTSTTSVDNSQPPPMPLEFMEVMKSRADLDPNTVWANFNAHYPPEKRTLARWTKWVASEHPPAKTNGHHGAIVTTPGPIGRDPELVRMERESKQAAPIPDAVRALRESFIQKTGLKPH